MKDERAPERDTKGKSSAALILGFGSPEGEGEGMDSEGPSLMRAIDRAQAAGDSERAWKAFKEAVRACVDEDDKEDSAPKDRRQSAYDDEDEGLSF